MADYICPHCGNPFDYREETCVIHRMNLEYGNLPVTTPLPYLSITILRCPGEKCHREIVLAEGHNGFMCNANIKVYPPASVKHFPDYVPEAIREDYKEAAMIVSRSPKAAATLCRRCLQGIIRDVKKIYGRNLYDEISQLKGNISEELWKAIDTVRRVGNIGAHMQQDVNTVFSITEEHAQMLIHLIEQLIDEWYIKDHECKELMSRIGNLLPPQQ